MRSENLMQFFARKWSTTSVFLLFLIITGCVIVPHKKYFASEAEVTILESGVPVACTTVRRKIFRSGELWEQQVVVTDENGVAKFEEVKKTGLVKLISSCVYDCEYSLKTSSEYRTIWFSGKTDPARYSDILFSGQDIGDTILVKEFDLDSLSKAPARK